MYKAILVHVDADDANSAGRVQLACQLAGECGATLLGVAAALPQPTVELLASGGAALAGGVLVSEHDDLEERFEAARTQFAHLTAEAGVTTQWRAVTDFPAVGLEAAAARADLIVVGPSRSSSARDGYFDYGDLVMRAGRPVLTVPARVNALAHRHAVVAWRNTPEARRALADAIALLALYSEVTLLHVREGAEAGDGGLEDAQAYLDGHSIFAATKTVDAGRAGAARAIVDFATSVHADLIVAGAYGHTRLSEWAFGGVTRQLFHGSPIACLLSH
jgi:nucleotide-binding universal stress UspA family protein